MSEQLAELFSEMRSVVADAIDDHPQGSLFAGLLAILESPLRQSGVQGTTRPVVDEWLDAAIAPATGPWRHLAELLGQATAELPWLTAYEDLDSTPEVEQFRSLYSYQLFAGPIFRGYEPAVLLDGALVGFTLQAPHVHYPAHHHEPPEMYGVISGSLQWQIGDTWSTVHPGDVMVHRSHESHAMRTGDVPALTWVVWSPNSNTAVYMPSLDPPNDTMEPIRY